MIKWWKPEYFGDLKPFDILPMEEVLERYLNTLKTFPQYEKAYTNGEFFLNIQEEDLEIPELKYFHEKFNSPFCKFDGPRFKMIFHLKENRQFFKKEYEIIDKESGTSNYNVRDGQIRGGWATPKIRDYYYKSKLKGIITGEWVYLTLPYKLTQKHLKESNNGYSWDIAKQFVKEVEESIGWEDTNLVKEIIDRYDNKYPKWNHDFPINGYVQMKKDGLLFPGPWVHNYNFCYHSFHRIIMTSMNKMDFPFFIPVPVVKDSNIFTTTSAANNFVYEGKLSYLKIEVDLSAKKSKFYFINEDGEFEYRE